MDETKILDLTEHRLKKVRAVKEPAHFQEEKLNVLCAAISAVMADVICCEDQMGLKKLFKRWVLSIIILTITCLNAPVLSAQELVLVRAGVHVSLDALRPALQVLPLRVAAIIDTDERCPDLDCWIDWAARQGFLQWGYYVHILEPAYFLNDYWWIAGSAGGICAEPNRRVSVSNFDRRAVNASLCALAHELGHLCGAEHSPRCRDSMCRYNIGQTVLNTRSMTQIYECGQCLS